MPHALAAPEFGTRPTRVVRHVPIGRVGRHVGLVNKKTRKMHPHSSLSEAMTLTPMTIG